MNAELINVERRIAIALHRLNQQVDAAIAGRDQVALAEAMRQFSGVGNQLEQYRLLLTPDEQIFEHQPSFNRADLLLRLQS